MATVLTPEEMDRQADNKLREVRSAWSEMHHNATLYHWPDFRNEYESNLFWEYMADEVHYWIEDLQNWIKEDFGYELHLYQYGRSGATIAPSEWMSVVGGNGFGSFNGGPLPDLWVDDNGDITPEAFKEYMAECDKVIEVIQRINEFWKNVDKDMPEWWTEEKDAAELNEEIAQMDGKKPYQETVWR